MLIHILLNLYIRYMFFILYMSQAVKILLNDYYVLHFVLVLILQGTVKYSYKYRSSLFVRVVVSI